MYQTVLMTGATGFVGSALALELLLTRPNARLYGIARGPDSTARLRAAIARAAAAYAPQAEVDSLLERVFALRGDLACDRLGLDDSAIARLRRERATVWHCAASLADTARDWPLLFATNVDGTRRVLDLASAIDATCVNYVSTAYVAGVRHGRLLEETVAESGFNNHYELSKAIAEIEVRDRAAHHRMPFRILRPSIVVSHSSRGTATGANGALGWILKLAMLRERFPELSRRAPLVYVAAGDSTLNIIPIDSVVQDAVAIDDAGAATHGRVFHLTNRDAPTIGDFAVQSASALGVALRIEASDAGLDPISRRFHEATRFERPYVTGPDKCFVRDDSERCYVSQQHGRCPLSDAWLQRVVAHAQRFVATMSRERAAS